MRQERVEPSVCVLYFNLSPTWEEKALVFCVRTDMTAMYVLFLRYPYKYSHIWLCLSRHAKGAWSLLGILDHWDATLYSSASIPSWTPFSLPTKNAFRFKSLHDKPFTLTITIRPLFSCRCIIKNQERQMGRERERGEGLVDVVLYPCLILGSH